MSRKGAPLQSISSFNTAEDAFRRHLVEIFFLAGSYLLLIPFRNTTWETAYFPVAVEQNRTRSESYNEIAPRSRPK